MTYDQEIRRLIADYVNGLETKPTVDVCKCEWSVDFPLPGGKVANRMRGTVNLDCPVHTREGLILGFLEIMQLKEGYSLIESGALTDD